MRLFGKTIDKKWLENYWYYYKIHTFAAIFIILIVTYTAVECANTVQPDAQAAYIGGMYLGSEFADDFEQRYAQVIDDINGDGVKKLQFTPLSISEEVKSEQDFAMQQKAQLEVAVGETFLFILDKGYFEMYAGQGLFIDLAEYIESDQPVYGLLADESDYLSEAGFEGKDVYAAVRVLTIGDEKKPKKVAMQNSAIKILQKLYENYEK